MILLQINSIIKVKPIKWEAKDLTGLHEAQKYIRFLGDHPENPEYGSVALSAKLKNGDPKGIREVLFIDENAQNGTLVRCEKNFLGGYTIEIQFDNIYRYGLEYCTREFIQKGSAFIGLTPSEKASLSSTETQKTLLSLMLDHIMPSKKKLILDFAKIAFVCMPNDQNDSNRSHYLGHPKHEKTLIKGPNENDLFHLSTLQLEHFPLHTKWSENVQSLSFYLRINDTEDGWPEEKDDFKVFNGHTIDSKPNSATKTDAVNFSIHPILDLPTYDHALIKHHNFSEENRDNFESLRSVYMQLVLGDKAMEDVNKFLGYPDNIQSCVSYEAERTFHNLRYSDEIYKDAINWVLLLQVSPYCHWFDFFDEFGDEAIYYMIKKEDLEAGDFTKCQVIVQNT